MNYCLIKVRAAPSPEVAASHRPHGFVGAPRSRVRIFAYPGGCITEAGVMLQVTRRRHVYKYCVTGSIKWRGTLQSRVEPSGGFKRQKTNEFFRLVVRGGSFVGFKAWLRNCVTRAVC